MLKILEMNEESLTRKEKAKDARRTNKQQQRRKLLKKTKTHTLVSLKTRLYQIRSQLDQLLAPNRKRAALSEHIYSLKSTRPNQYQSHILAIT